MSTIKYLEGEEGGKGFRAKTETERGERPSEWKKNKGRREEWSFLLLGRVEKNGRGSLKRKNHRQRTFINIENKSRRKGEKG